MMTKNYIVRWAIGCMAGMWPYCHVPFELIHIPKRLRQSLFEEIEFLDWVFGQEGYQEMQ